MTRRAVALLFAIAMAGCARMPAVQSDGLTLDERRARLARIEGWEMRGRLAIDTGDRGYQARFQWQQERDRLRLTVWRALGGSFRIDGSPAALTLSMRGETYELDDPEAELSDLVGWWLPVTSMDDWLMGLPDDEFAAETRARSGVLTSLAQRLWQVDYAEYQINEGLAMPRRLTLSHGPLTLDLRVDAWSPVAPPSVAAN